MTFWYSWGTLKHMKPINLQCGHCGGTGTVPLPDHLETVLTDLCDQEMTTSDLIQIAKSRDEAIKLPAMCNRLNTLVRLGLVTKHKTNAPTGGAWYLWRRVS